MNVHISLKGYMNITSAEGYEAMSKLKGMLRKSFTS